MCENASVSVLVSVLVLASVLVLVLTSVPMSRLG